MKLSLKDYCVGTCLKHLATIWFLSLFFLIPSQSTGTELSPQSKLNRIKQAISTQNERVHNNVALEFNLEQELKQLDKQLTLEQEKLQKIQHRLSRQDNYLQTKQQETVTINCEKVKMEGHIKNRLSAFFKMGDVTILNTLFAAQNLPEFLHMKEYFQAMFHYDQELIRKYRTKLFLLSEAKNNITQNKNKLLRIIDQEKEQEQQLIKSRQDRNNLLQKIKMQKELYQQALQEMEKYEASLIKTIKKLQVPEIRSKSKKLYKKKLRHHQHPISGFAAQAGKLPNPVQGSIISYVKNERADQQATPTGLDFITEPGAEIRAIYDGKIIYSDKMTGYGNMLIIDHGQQFYSLVSGLGLFIKTKGNQVQTGELVARTISHSETSKSKLHFELRHGPKPLDPRRWLKR